jgi:hypothetical protein
MVSAAVRHFLTSLWQFLAFYGNLLAYAQHFLPAFAILWQSLGILSDSLGSSAATGLHT